MRSFTEYKVHFIQDAEDDYVIWLNDPDGLPHYIGGWRIKQYGAPLTEYLPRNWEFVGL